MYACLLFPEEEENLMNDILPNFKRIEEEEGSLDRTPAYMLYVKFYCLDPGIKNLKWMETFTYYLHRRLNHPSNLTSL